MFLMVESPKTMVVSFEVRMLWEDPVDRGVWSAVLIVV